MTPPAKTSTALTIAWLVLIAGLIAAIVFFTLSTREAPTEPDAPVVPVPVKPKVPDRRPPMRVPGRNQPGPDTMQRDRGISGTVRSPEGNPVGGARIVIAPPGTKSGPASAAPDMDAIKIINQMIYIAPEDWDVPRPLATWAGESEGGGDEDTTEIASALTGDDGTFKIALATHAGGGPFRLTAHKDEVGSASISDVRGGGEPLDITLGPESNVKGTVVTEVDSVGVEGARVTFDNGARRISAVSGPGGQFVVEGVTPGRYELVVGAKGHTPLFDAAYTVHPNDSVPVTLRLPRGTVLRVKAIIEIVDQTAAAGTARDGDPVADAQIVAYSEDAGIYVLGKTNAAGTADFEGLPAGRYALNGMATGVISIGEEQIVIDRNQQLQEHTVTFEPAVDTPIEVVDEDGRAVAGVDFYTVNADEKYDSLRSMKIGATDGEGKLKFPFEFVGPRSTLFGFKQGYALVRAFPEDNTTGDALRLVAKKPIRVHGVIKTSDGRAIPDTVVTISITPADDLSDDMELEIRADKDGRYDFPYLPRSEGITISATAPDGISQEDHELELVDGQTDYAIPDLLIEFEEPVMEPMTAPRPRAPEGPMRPGDRIPPK